MLIVDLRPILQTYFFWNKERVWRAQIVVNSLSILHQVFVCRESHSSLVVNPSIWYQSFYYVAALLVWIIHIMTVMHFELECSM